MNDLIVNSFTVVLDELAQTAMYQAKTPGNNDYRLYFIASMLKSVTSVIKLGDANLIKEIINQIDVALDNKVASAKKQMCEITEEESKEVIIAALGKWNNSKN